MLQISKRLLSAASICRPRPQLSAFYSLQLTSIGAVEFMILGTSTHSPCQRIKNVRKSVEEETLDTILQKCKTIEQLKHVHLQILINNINSNYYYLLAEKLMLFSSDEICFEYAYRVFMDLPTNPSLSSYNTLIKCSIGKSDNIAASAFNRMRNKNQDIIISPDRFTLAFLVKSFASFSRLRSGQTVHGHVIKLGFISDTFVMNSLLEFYLKFVQCRPDLGVVRKLFEEMPKRDIVSWNTMISSLVRMGFEYEALLAFDDMLLSADQQCKPDETTLISMVSACIHMNLVVDQGKWLDSYIKENKLGLSVPLGNALMTMFACFRDPCDAKMVFKSMPKRSALTWERMMGVLSVEGFCEEVLALFDTMCCCSAAAEEEEDGGLKPNADIFRSVLIAFSKDERLVGDGERLFRVIHQMVHEFGIKPSSTHIHFLIRIFSQAGWVEAAMMLAESLTSLSDTFVWAKVLCACQIHGNDDDLFLDTWIRKISDVNSKEDHPRHFMRCTIKSYIHLVFSRKPNNDVNYAKLMVESLIRKLPDREHVRELNMDLEYQVLKNSTQEGRDKSISAHARETLPPHYEDDVYKAAESLDRQLFDLHDEMINIIDHPCLRGTAAESLDRQLFGLHDEMINIIDHPCLLLGT